MKRMPPVTEPEEREALLSAIQRLPHAVLTFDGARNLRPINHSGLKLIEKEQISSEVLRSDPEHPLAQLLGATLDGATEATHTIEFPGGSIYEIDVSVRSSKGRGRWLILICRDLSHRAVQEQDAKFAIWRFTARERDIARLLCSGLTTEQICDELEIAPNTVKTHISNLLGKCRCATRAAFMARMHAPLPLVIDGDD